MKTSYLILLISIISCNPPGASFDQRHTISILFLNNENEIILLKDSSEFNLKDLTQYYLNVDMEYVMRYSGGSAAPSGISSTIEESGLLLMWPLFGEEDGTYTVGGKSTTYLDFGNGDIDTIEVSGIKEKNRSIIRDVWYNGVQVVESTENEFNQSEFPENGFTVVK